MSRSVVAVIDWRAAAGLKENARLLERARKGGRLQPRERRAEAAGFRSLTLRADGSCELQRASVAAVARRIGAGGARRVARREG